MINKVTLVGNLGADPEMRALESGVKIARLRLATNESYRDQDGNWQDRTEWHTVILWRQLAERAERSLRKGMTIYLDGKLTTRKWQDQSGNDRYTTEVVGSYLRILKGNDANGGSPGRFPSEEPTGSETGNASSPAPAAPAPTSVPEDDDLPF